MIFAGDHKNDKYTAKKLLKSIIVLVILITPLNLESKEKKEKDCTYCKKYERLKDWPEQERPVAFIYEKIEYPEGMFHNNDKTSKQKQTAAGKKVY